MKKLLSQVGFTLIELLVVISVIGVLAVAVLSSINPVEQINKGRDTGARSDAAQLINAVDRYYATQEKFPWNNTNTACSGLACPDSVGAPVGTGLSAVEIDPATEFPDDTAAAPDNFPNVCLPEAAPSTIGIGLCKVSGQGVGGGWLTGLATTSEVKPAFVSRLQALTTYAIYVYKNPGADSTMFACFRPSSKAFQTEAVEKGCQDANVVTGWGGTAAPAIVVTAACPNGDASTWGTKQYVQSATHDELICLP